MCCKTYVYFICNCAVGKHFPHRFFQLWTLLRAGMLWLLLECFPRWLIFSIHLFANRGKFKSLGKLWNYSWESGLCKRLEQQWGVMTDHINFALKLTKGIRNYISQCLVFPDAMWHWTVKLLVLTSDSIFLETFHSKAAYKLYVSFNLHIH